MTEAINVTRPPKQERSRASFEKALDAAAELMAERGDDSFTLQEVTQRSGVSIGSIYGRVEGKRELVRAVQERVLQRHWTPMREEFDQVAAAHHSLPAVLPALVDTWAEQMRRSAPILRAIMSVATRDSEVERVGAASYLDLKSRMGAILLRHSDEILRPDPELAVDACLTIIYSALARHLGFGTSADAAGQGDWRSLKREVGIMGLAYLTYQEDTH